MGFFFYEYLGAAEKKNMGSLPQHFTGVAEQRAVWQRNRHRAWASLHFSLNETWMFICPFIRIPEPLHVFCSKL